MLSTFLVQSFIDWICEPICINIITLYYNIFKICCDFYLYFAVIIIADQIRNARLHSNLMVSKSIRIYVVTLIYQKMYILLQ